MLQRLRTKQEPQIDGPRGREPYHPEVAATFQRIAKTHEERDKLKEENAELHDRIALLSRETKFLEGKLQAVENDRGFYERHYIALHSRLADLVIDVENLRTKIDHAITEAKREADAAGMRKDMSGIEAKGLNIVETALEPTKLPEGEGFQSQTDHG